MPSTKSHASYTFIPQNLPEVVSSSWKTALVAGQLSISAGENMATFDVRKSVAEIDRNLRAR